jgi:hypothetical protein
MSLRRKIVSIVAPAALVLVGACASPFKADVSRFQMMPPPQGQTFIVQASDPRLQGGIEFATYARLVSERLSEQGYQPAADGQSATLVVTVDYGVDGGHEKVVSTPGMGWGGYGGYGGFGGGGFGRPWGYGGFGRPFYGRGFYYGWADPFWYQPFGYPDVRSYTFYVSQLQVKIARAADNQTLFEGKARARSTTDSLPYLVPNLVEAMFTGFPGRSGEDVLITVPPPPKEPKDAGAPINNR